MVVRLLKNIQKSNERYELTYFTNERFLVQLDGEKVGIDELKQVAKNLNLKTN
jgi:hypothetical protein